MIGDRVIPVHITTPMYGVNANGPETANKSAGVAEAGKAPDSPAVLKWVSPGL